ncbi:MAG: hemerythrin domain-containing protein [Bacteroidales bacterium]|nr:hemerythrin domain-containing protein [Bacteroidales bacterium]
MQKIFSENMKMADLVLGNSKLLLMFPRFGMNLGFGDHSIAEVCAMNNVSAPFFLMICNVYCNNDYTPSLEDIASVDLKALINYLLESHKYYLHERLPHIEEHLDHIINACIPKYGNMLRRFFQEYKNEVVDHFIYEEKNVFPYMEQLANQDVKTDYKIKVFHENHTNIEDKLSDLMNILVKYLPADVFPKERIEIALDINELSADLMSHALIEERVLIPFVESLEA